MQLNKIQIETPYNTMDIFNFFIYKHTHFFDIFRDIQNPILYFSRINITWTALKEN